MIWLSWAGLGWARDMFGFINLDGLGVWLLEIWLLGDLAGLVMWLGWDRKLLGNARDLVLLEIWLCWILQGVGDTVGLGWIG